MSASRLSKIAVLKLSPKKLASFPSSSTSSTPAEENKSNKVKDEATPQPNGSENSTPVPNDDAPKRRGGPGPRGVKRAAQTDADGNPKPKGKPGPKKRKPDENGIVPTPAAPKLGPKANVGAINANLRALDRTGAPTRRWAKKGIVLKTFTGVVWDLPYWSSPKGRSTPADGEPQSESGGGSSDAKLGPASSMIGSEADRDGAGNGLPDVAASSPAGPSAMEVSTPA